MDEVDNRIALILSGFIMETDHLCTGLCKPFDVLLGMHDHQVDVHGFHGFPGDGFHHRETEGQVGNEDAVHDVEMEQVRGGVDRFYGLRQMQKVGGQDGGGYEHVRRN